MKILACPNCKDVFGLLGKEWRVCVCGESGGQYNTDLMTATLGGRARVFGVGNLFFNELFPYLTEEGKQKARPKVGGYSGPNDCWWGEFPGDVQIFRIDSPSGPRLKVKVLHVDPSTNKVVVVDKRKFTIDGRSDLREVVVPSNPRPFARQLIRHKK